MILRSSLEFVVKKISLYILSKIYDLTCYTFGLLSFYKLQVICVWELQQATGKVKYHS